MNASAKTTKRESRERPDAEAQARHRDSKKSEKANYEIQAVQWNGPIVEDRIRKELTSRERKAEREWWKKYDYLSGEYFQQVLAEECQKAGLPIDTFRRKPPEDPVKKSPIPLEPSPPVPRTSSAIVGWRSSRSRCNLEFIGSMYVSPSTNIEPPLEHGEFRVTNQRFIFLG